MWCRTYIYYIYIKIYIYLPYNLKQQLVVVVLIVTYQVPGRIKGKISHSLPAILYLVLLHRCCRGTSWVQPWEILSTNSRPTHIPSILMFQIVSLSYREVNRVPGM